MKSFVEFATEGLKAPRKGAVAYYAALKRKEQEKNKAPIEPKDQMVGTAKVVKEDGEIAEDFTKMDTPSLKKWITTRERNSMAANLSKKRSDQYDQAQSELKRRREVKEETQSDDDHFAAQSPKMQDAINLHLRKGKSYKDAVEAAQQHVKEDADLNESWMDTRSSYDGPGKGELLGKMSEKDHVDAVNYHGTQMDQLKKGTHKYSKMYSKDQVQAQYNKHHKLWSAHKDALDAHTMKEESEQLDELSYKTLQSYRQGAHNQIQHYKYAGGKDKPEASKVLAKREPGMEKATDKVVKKDAEARAAAPKRPPEQHKEKYPLGGRDEISGRSYSEEVEFVEEDFTKMDTPTLKKWITTRERNSMAANLSKKRSDQYDQATAELKNRRQVKEDIEQVDELNQMTLSRYAAKARTDVAKQAHTAGTAASVDDAKKDFDKAKKRQAGVSAANRKLRFGEYSEMCDKEKKQ